MNRPRETRGRFRRPLTLFIYWREGRLLFHNFATRQTFSAEPVVCEVLNFFRRWRTSQEAVNYFSNYARGSVRSTVAELVGHGLLLRKDSIEAIRDNRIAKVWHSWLPEGSFHFSTKDTPYVDRSNWNQNRLARILPKRSRRPNLFKISKGAKKTQLPASSFPESEFLRVLMTRRTHRQFSKRKLSLEVVSQLLSLVWGVSGYLHSKMFGASLLKTSPSGGAQHPGEVYLVALRSTR